MAALGRPGPLSEGGPPGRMVAGRAGRRPGFSQPLVEGSPRRRRNGESGDRRKVGDLSSPGTGTVEKRKERKKKSYFTAWKGGLRMEKARREWGRQPSPASSGRLPLCWRKNSWQKSG